MDSASGIPPLPRRSPQRDSRTHAELHEMTVPMNPPCHEELTAVWSHPLSPEEELDLLQLQGKIFGDYSIREKLGAGGMGIVFLAENCRLKRLVALKLLSKSLAQTNPHYIEQFQQEGQTIAQLHHPNIVIVHALGELGGAHYLEMEYVAGYSLYHLVKEEGPLKVERALGFMQRIAEGMALAHEKNILHRDLKPQNVLVDLSQIPKIVDFGLAKRVDHASSRRLPLQGTPPYMAPELFKGDPPSPATDVYALGVMFYFLLTGHHPYWGHDLNELMHQVLHAPIPDVTQLRDDLSSEIQDALASLLEKDPRRRPPHAGEVRELFARLLGHVEPLHELLKLALSKVPLAKYHPLAERHGYEVILTLPQGRRQVVHVVESEASTAERLLIVESCCGDNHAQVNHEELLRLNANNPYGAICLCVRDGRDVLVVRNTHLRHTLDVDEIRRSVIEIAHHADALEKMLRSDVDRF
ncbi:MAG: hypothetical protein KatS3mg114_1128 [Planctomycetaceae bacterium]|nr:MAG: hypothetical protein KatS3mg114_1128 [Planctomycetaceae bacterium]